MKTEQQLRDAEIEVAYQYLQQKDWERMNKKRELMSWAGLTVMMIGLAGLALGGVKAFVIALAQDGHISDWGDAFDALNECAEYRAEPDPDTFDCYS